MTSVVYLRYQHEDGGERSEYLVPVEDLKQFDTSLSDLKTISSKNRSAMTEEEIETLEMLVFKLRNAGGYDVDTQFGLETDGINIVFMLTVYGWE